MHAMNVSLDDVKYKSSTEFVYIYKSIFVVFHDDTCLVNPQNLVLKVVKVWRVRWNLQL